MRTMMRRKSLKSANCRSYFSQYLNPSNKREEEAILDSRENCYQVEVSTREREREREKERERERERVTEAEV